MATKTKGKKNPHAVALGKLAFKKCGQEHFQKIGQVGGLRGGKSTLDRHGKEHFSDAGKRGGKSRARNLSAERMSEIGRKGAATRWAKKKSPTANL